MSRPRSWATCYTSNTACSSAARRSSSAGVGHRGLLTLPCPQAAAGGPCLSYPSSSVGGMEESVVAAVEVMLLAGADPVQVAAAVGDGDRLGACPPAGGPASGRWGAAGVPRPHGPAGRPGPGRDRHQPALVHRCCRRPGGPGPAVVRGTARCAGRAAGRTDRSAQGPGDRPRHLRTGPGGAGAAGRAGGRLRRRPYPRPAAGLADPPGRRDRPRRSAAQTQAGRASRAACGWTPNATAWPPWAPT